MVILLAVSLADLGWRLIPPPEKDNASADQALLDARPDEIADVSASVRPLSPGVKLMFGSPAAAEQEISDDVPVQETRLNLTLKGILADNMSGNRLALIANAGQPEEVYRIGDKVAGAEIIQISQRRVLIRHNGMTESLNLEIEKLQQTIPPSPMNISRSDFGQNGIRQISDRERVVSQETLKQQLKNLPRLLQQAKTVPHIENGQQVGFRVVDIQSGSVFQDLGLEQEDIIQSVNGTPVRTVEEALNAYRTLRTADAFQVDLLRGGRVVTINFSIQ